MVLLLKTGSLLFQIFAFYWYVQLGGSEPTELQEQCSG